jgi:hypothetical protein
MWGDSTCIWSVQYVDGSPTNPLCVLIADVLIPPLFSMVRSSQMPTTLRTSSLSLLADCGHTSILSLLPYSSDLFEAMIDILQVESISAIAPVQASGGQSGEDQDAQETMDAQPTSTNPKFPPLRRAALHFLSLLLRMTTQSLASASLPAFSMKRARTTLSYVASTDPDVIVRVMAQEAVVDLKNLGQAMIGL